MPKISLAQLKRTAANYTWRMIRHSWYPQGALIGLERKVIKVQGNAIQFEPAPGKTEGSWLSWDSPARCYRINELAVGTMDGGTWTSDGQLEVTIQLNPEPCEGRWNEVMQYILTPVK
jgi:hypothetical protein